MRPYKVRSRVVTSVLTSVLVVAAMTVPLAGPAAANHGDCVIDVTPNSDSNTLGQTHVLTATLEPAPTETSCDRAGGTVTVNFDVDADVNNASYSPTSIDGDPGNTDLSCSIANNDDDCTVSYTRLSPTGTDTITGEVADDPTVDDTVTKTWTSGAATFLNVTPETDSNPSGTTHTMTATVRNASGGLVSGANVDFEVIDGPNENFDNLADDADGRCPAPTGIDGTCELVYTDADSTSTDDVDTICAWIDTSDGNSVYDPDGVVADGGDCDAETNTETEDSSVSGTDTFGNDATDRVTKTWTGGTSAGPATTLDVDPETETNAVQTSHTLTATARDADGDLVSGADVDFEIMTGPNDNLDGNASDADRGCTTGSNGTCSVSYTDGATNPAAPNNVDTICGWLDTDDDSTFNEDGVRADGGDCDAETPGETEGNDDTDKVRKTWSTTASGDADLLNVTPESETNAVRTSHTLTATTRDGDGDLVSGVDVDFEITAGPNDNFDGDSSDPDFSCTTGSNGTCTVSYTDGVTNPAAPNNVDTICGWLDTDDDTVFNDDGDINDGGACDVEDPEETDNSDVPGTDSFGNDATDVVEKTWGTSASGDAQLLNVTPESEVNAVRTTHTVTATTRDSDGDLVSGVDVDFEIIDGPNDNLDGDSTDPDLSCTTGSNGTCSVSYTDGVTNPSAPDNVDAICGWLDSDDDTTFDDDGDINDGGACDVEDPNETDDSDEPGTDNFGNDATDVVEKTWGEAVDAPQLLNVTPEAETNARGGTHTLSATARDEDGDRVAGVRIDFEVIDGPNANLDGDSNDVDLTCTTGSDGECDVDYDDDDSSSSDNVDTICAWLDVDGDSNFDDDEDISDGGACDVESVNESDDSSISGTDSFGNDATDSVRKTWGTSSLPPICRDTPNAIIGTSGSDRLEGTSGEDVICGLGGNDTILGFGDDDFILGGGGADVLRGGFGNDFVQAGRGSDTLFGGSGSDTLRARGGNDFLFGGRQDDFLLGGRGRDLLNGGRGTDGCNGGPGRDRRRNCEGRVVGG